MNKGILDRENISHTEMKTLSTTISLMKSVRYLRKVPANIRGTTVTKEQWAT